MACLTFEKSCKKWRVLWRATARKGPVKGKVFSGSRMFLEKSQAVGFWGDVEKEERLWRTGEADVSETLDSAVDNFSRHIKRFTQRTQQHYSMVLERFTAKLRIISYSQLNSNHIQDYIYAMKRQRKENRTCNAHLTVIKSFCRYCSSRYNLYNPSIEIKMLTESPPVQRFLTPEELNRVLEISNPLSAERILFIANTGLRATEFCNLRWTDLHGDSLTITGKGRKRRTVPLNKTCLTILNRLKVNKPTVLYPIFLSKSGGGLNKGALWLQFSRLATNASIPAFGPHALRHYFASQLLLKGVDIALVSKILGHSSIRTTEQCYIHILPDHLRGVTDCL